MGCGDKARGFTQDGDVAPPNPRPAFGIPSPIWPGVRLRSAEHEGSHLPACPLGPFHPPRAPDPPAGWPGGKLRLAGARYHRASATTALHAPPPLATRSASLGRECPRKASGSARWPLNQGSVHLTSSGGRADSALPCFLTVTMRRWHSREEERCACPRPRCQRLRVMQENRAPP